jgi:GrpB-like predicted nucleotidyltransferase (UPF0157 family)
MRTIQVLPYDPRWANNFREIAAVLKRALWREALAIEHFGSTSVPGLAAKPILDIMVIIPDTIDAFRKINLAVNRIGYDHEGDLGITGREAFRNRDKYAPYDMSGREWPVHYLYVCKNHAPVLVDYLAFRDYLRKNPRDAAEYGRVKMQAAELHPHDIDGYMAYKKECAERILQKAETNKKSVTQYLDFTG